MAGCQDVLTDTYIVLIAQKASAKVILEVLVDEAALLFPSLERPDLEAIVMGVLEEDRERIGGRPARPNVLLFSRGDQPTRAVN